MSSPATTQGSINLRYLAPPTAVCAIAAGVVVGAALTPWGFVVPGGYLAAIAAGSVPAGKGLPLKARLQIPRRAGHHAHVVGLRLPDQPARRWRRRSSRAAARR